MKHRQHQRRLRPIILITVLITVRMAGLCSGLVGAGANFNGILRLSFVWYGGHYSTIQIWNEGLFPVGSVHPRTRLFLLISILLPKRLYLYSEIVLNGLRQIIKSRNEIRGGFTL